MPVPLCRRGIGNRNAGPDLFSMPARHRCGKRGLDGACTALARTCAPRYILSADCGMAQKVIFFIIQNETTLKRKGTRKQHETVWKNARE